MNTDPSNPSDPSLQKGIEGKWFTINLLLRKCIANFNKTFEIYRHYHYVFEFAIFGPGVQEIPTHILIKVW